jgi:hypothetical protein
MGKDDKVLQGRCKEKLLPVDTCALGALVGREKLHRPAVLRTLLAVDVCLSLGRHVIHSLNR